MIKQYVISHQPTVLPDYPDLCLIQVGSQEPFSDLQDNVGENISEKNANYCELTALYWIWKNDDQSRWVGINHYRRFFKDLKRPDWLEAQLEQYDLLVPKFEPYKESVERQYCLESGFEEDLKKVRAILARQHPEDVWAYDQVMKQGGLYLYNMMIASKPVFDEYCQWLFDILFALEGQVDLSGYSDYQKRIYGFLGERLLNVYILARGLKVKPLPVEQHQYTLYDKMRLMIRRPINRIRFAFFKRNEINA